MRKVFVDKNQSVSKKYITPVYASLALFMAIKVLTMMGRGGREKSNEISHHGMAITIEFFSLLSSIIMYCCSSRTILYCRYVLFKLFH